MPVIGVPVTGETPATPSRFTATPVKNQNAPCCDTLPSAQVVPSLISCANLNVLAVTPTERYKQPLFERIRTIRIQAGQQAVISWTMQNRAGNPISLTDCVCGPPESSSSAVSESSLSETVLLVDNCPLKLKFRLREQVAIGTCRPPAAEYDVAITSAETGEVQITLTKDDTQSPGIYFGEVAVIGVGDDGEEYVYFSNTFYVAIEQGNWSGNRPGRIGPPSFAEVRLHLRDSSPAENNLLADLMFDDAEIAMAISRPIEYWNEIPPPIQRFTTQSFPYRYHWLEAIAGELFLMAEEGYRRNHLAYSSAGFSVDDQNKEANYGRAAQQRLIGWREFVKRKKAELNIAQGFGEVRSSYGSRLSF